MKLLLGLLIALSIPAFADIANNCVTKSQTEFGSSTVSIKALNSNTRRRCLLIQNKSAGSTAYLSFGAAGTGTTGIALPAGGIYSPAVPPADQVYINSSAGIVTCYVLDGN